MNNHRPAGADPFTFTERAVYVAPADALVLADVHLGQALDSSVEAPVPDGADVIDRLATLLDRHRPGEVVVAGDLVHAFSHIPPAVEAELRRFETVVEAADAALVVVRGNHDVMLPDVVDDVPETYRLADGETVVCHGHERPDVHADRYVVGHDHPALSVEGRKHPCFLYGPTDTGSSHDDTTPNGTIPNGTTPTVLVLPAFTRLSRGTTVNRQRTRDFQSPFVSDADALRPVVYDSATDEPLWFPPLGACRHVL